jgi:hypothetical protein
MLELLSQDGLRPFLVSGLLVFGFLALEIILMMLGLSGGGETDAPEIDTADIEGDFVGMEASDIAAEMDIDPSVAAQIESEIALQDGTEAFDTEVEATSSGETSLVGSILDLMGMRKLPLSVSLALFAAGFAAAGISTQVILHSVSGMMLPKWIMVPVAIVAAAVLTRKLSGFVVRIIPSEETAAVSERSLGRRRGVVTVGVASAGRPAEVRVTDGYGNTHYIMVEPLSAKDEIPAGSEVLVLRMRGGEFRLVKTG